MPHRNETSAFDCRFLRSCELELVHAVFVEAFSDYIVQFKLSETQFRNHIVLNAVDLERSVGCFEDGRLVGVSLNAFGNWNGRPTVYDAGTGVIPSHRRRGASDTMFAMMLPVFASAGYEQCLLEVISHNEKAVKFYEKLNFEKIRDLLLLEAAEPPAVAEPPKGIELREIESIQAAILQSLGDGKPSWQNTLDAIRRSHGMKRVVGAYDGKQCVGFIAFSAGVARVAQISVLPEYRRRGIATSLLGEMTADLRPGFRPQVINIDASIDGAVSFFRNRGYSVVLQQFEMRKIL